MQHIKTHKINKIYLQPGDTINLEYSFEEPKDTWNKRWLTLDTVEESTIVDTLIVYRTEVGEYGLKSGRALVMGEDDGAYKHLPITNGHKLLIGNRVQV